MPTPDLESPEPESATPLAASFHATSTRQTRPGKKTSVAAGIIAARDWLLEHGPDQATADDVLREAVGRICAGGCLLSRVMVSIRTLHPQVAAITYAWNAGQSDVEVTPRGHSVLSNDMYLASPIRHIHSGEPMIRRRLVDRSQADDFPILDELRSAGATDYIVLPLKFSGNRINAVSFTTRHPDGFDDDAVAALQSFSRVLALVLDPLETRRIARALLGTYLGADAGRRVLDGLVRRGDGVTIAAALMFTDLRGFTAMSETLSREQVLDLLNSYFDAMAPAVQAQGGEILKFVGDGMLAIFPMKDDLDRDRACRSALVAAKDGSAAIDALNVERAKDGLSPLDVGITLHSGSVSYGNIGTADRLDFTVIGPAVNLVSRMQSLCEPLGRRIIASRRFASACHSDLVPIGRHRFKGIADEQQVYGLPG
ncbi:MAG: adenylate/guanylate cyclase domain-containing protein [Dongiaceae bacterium]